VLAVPMRVELIVIDDCSTDGTRDQLTRLQQQHGFTLLLQERNQGKGAAIRRGFEAVTGDVVVIQDADLEYSPEEFPQLVELIVDGRADVVYGSRFLGRHRVFLFTHYLGNRALTLLTNILYNTMLTDMETCYKVMRREVLDDLRLQSVPRLRSADLLRRPRLRGGQEDRLEGRRRRAVGAPEVPLHELMIDDRSAYTPRAALRLTVQTSCIIRRGSRRADTRDSSR